MLTRRLLVAAALAWPAQALAQARPPSDPEIGHAAALAAAAELQARADGLLRRRGLTGGSVAERLRAAAADPRFLYDDDDGGRDCAVRDMNVSLERIRRMLSRPFGGVRLPAAEIRRMSRADEAARRSGYRDPAMGAYYVDLTAIRSRPSWTLPSVVYHETIPGHLLQIAAGGPANGVYAEAWATYAEQLCAELGAYRGDVLAELGFVHWRLFRLARVVADTGMQANGWSAGQAAEAMRSLQGFPVGFTTIEADVGRMRQRPGEYAAQGLAALALSRARPRDPQRWAAFHRRALAGPPWDAQRAGASGGE